MTLVSIGNRQPSGRMVRCIGGYQAYVPDPLPPPIIWNQNLTVALSSADRAIGKLAGEGRRLPNPHLLLRPFVRKEAVLSSRIEGTQATLGELLIKEAGAAVYRTYSDLYEVGNYVAALEYGLNRLETLPCLCVWFAKCTNDSCEGFGAIRLCPASSAVAKTGSVRPVPT